MGTLVTYERNDAVATISMDDGKVNVLSLAMLSELNAAFDQAEADGAVPVLSGRPGVFSAGFDLAVLTGGGEDALRMLRGGFELSERLLSLSLPVVIACTGHALAMGSFLLLSGDYRLGAEGAFKIGANEVAIGMVMPQAAIEVCRQRLATPFFGRAVIDAEIFSPATAVQAGFLDATAPADALAQAALGIAGQLAGLNLQAHAATKLRTRREVLDRLHRAIEDDDAALRAALR